MQDASFILRINNWFFKVRFLSRHSVFLLFLPQTEESWIYYRRSMNGSYYFERKQWNVKLGFQFNLHCKRRGKCGDRRRDENNTGNDESTALYSSRCVISILSTLTSNTNKITSQSRPKTEQFLFDIENDIL